MEAKLIKDKDGSFHLSHVPSGWWIGDTDHEKVKQHKGEQILSKLSLKNCQAIELGYDLDELADECQNILIKDNWRESPSQKIAFTLGFQKALEILGDKKFSMTDMKRARDKGERDGEILWDEFIKSLQQNEWLVEIVKETYHDCKFVDDGNTYSFEPKWREALDEKNCIILKKI